MSHHTDARKRHSQERLNRPRRALFSGQSAIQNCNSLSRSRVSNDINFFSGFASAFNLAGSFPSMVTLPADDWRCDAYELHNDWVPLMVTFNEIMRNDLAKNLPIFEQHRDSLTVKLRALVDALGDCRKSYVVKNGYNHIEHPKRKNDILAPRLMSDGG